MKTFVDNLPAWVNERMKEARSQAESSRLKRDQQLNEGRALAYEHVLRQFNPEHHELTAYGANVIIVLSQNDPWTTVVSVTKVENAEVSIQVQADDEIVAEL
jgi:hypothetical protein